VQRGAPHRSNAWQPSQMLGKYSDSPGNYRPIPPASAPASAPTKSSSQACRQAGAQVVMRSAARSVGAKSKGGIGLHPGLGLRMGFDLFDNSNGAKPNAGPVPRRQSCVHKSWRCPQICKGPKAAPPPPKRRVSTERAYRQPITAYQVFDQCSPTQLTFDLVLVSRRAVETDGGCAA
jgi:hypothetical protein